MKLVNPSTIGQERNNVPVLDGPQVVFPQTRHIENDFIGTGGSRQEPRFLLLFLQEPWYGHPVVIGLFLAFGIERVIGRYTDEA